MELLNWINRDIVCTCGRTHRCDIACVEIGKDALACVPEKLGAYAHILLVADSNTYAVCGDRVRALLGEKIAGACIFETDGILVPDEAAVEMIEAELDDDTDFILGIGSGVINDLCKFVSFHHGQKCGIIATAPSMDGFASSGAAMILGGMKVTETTHAPMMIIGDIDLLKTAPDEMIRAGYADIIGKYSALCDWKLSALVNGEYICQDVYDLVMRKTDEIRAMAHQIAAREDDAIAALMESLVLIGVCLTLLGTTRPGSGSEHHMSHYFEITGLLSGQHAFLHGIDVGYATIMTAGLREELCRLDAPTFYIQPEEDRERCYRAIYGPIWTEVRDLQRQAGRYASLKHDFYREHWDEIKAILAKCPPQSAIAQMMTDVGFDLSLFEKHYGREKIQRGVWFAKDLKDRYSVLWLYDDVFFSEGEAAKV